MNGWWCSNLGEGGGLISLGTRCEKGPLYHNILSCQLLRLLRLLHWDLFSKKCTFLGKSKVFGVEGVDFDYSKLFWGEK